MFGEEAWESVQRFIVKVLGARMPQRTGTANWTIALQTSVGNQEKKVSADYEVRGIRVTSLLPGSEIEPTINV